jgi:hypothetical protein
MSRSDTPLESRRFDNIFLKSNVSRSETPLEYRRFNNIFFNWLWVILFDPSSRRANFKEKIMGGVLTT